jgi:hypothetical protein
MAFYRSRGRLVTYHFKASYMEKSMVLGIAAGYWYLMSLGLLQNLAKTWGCASLLFSPLKQ